MNQYANTKNGKALNLYSGCIDGFATYDCLQGR